MNCCADTKLGLALNQIFERFLDSLQEGSTALMHAAQYHERAAACEMIKCLVEHGADVNAAGWVCSLFSCVIRWRGL